MQIWKQSTSDVNCKDSKERRHLVCLRYIETARGWNVVSRENSGRRWHERLEAVARNFCLIAVEVPEVFHKGKNSDLISLLEIFRKITQATE